MSKQKIIVIGGIIVGLLIVIGILIIQNNNENLLDGVTMTIKEGTLTRTSATVVIIDHTEQNYIYGEDFTIVKKNFFGQWKALPRENNFYHLVAHYVNESGKLELTHNWQSEYGELSNGTYRLIKKVNDKNIYVEFIIA